MAKEQLIAINDAVYKLQLAMLDGITNQKQLFAAGALMSRLDYEDIVTERTIAKLCGYPLCRTSLPSEVSRRGKYKISLKEHKVYDIQETRKFCSVDCLLNSRAFSGTLQEARTAEFDMAKLDEILRLFSDSEVKDSLSVSEDLGLSKLTIHENADMGGGEVSLEQWMGPSNAVEGYVPLDRRNNKSRNGKLDSKATLNSQEKVEESLFSEMDFSSTIIMSEGYSVSKLPSQTKQASRVGDSEDGEGKAVVREPTAVPPRKKNSRFRKDREKERNKKNFGFDEIDCANSVFMGDGYSVEYSVSKQPPCSTEDLPDGELKGDLKTLGKKSSLTGPSSVSKTKGSVRKPEKVGNRAPCTEYLANSCENGDKVPTAESCKGSEVRDVGSSSETILKSCLQVSGSKKPSRSVTWADENDGGRDLCETREEDNKAGLNPSSTVTEDVNSVSRLALAEACATALSQAAEAVASGNLDASDAAAEAGFILLPNGHQLDDELSEELEEEMPEEEPTLLKWPNKPGIPDIDLFDRDQSWLDGPPVGFNITLSSFAMMWNALFGWVSSSSLAYIYGKDESTHEEFLLVNGREYPRRSVLGDGSSSEIKETIAGCLARTLPRVATVLGLRIPISVLENGLGSLLETMSLREAVPSFKLKEWVVIVLLFLEALSVSRFPLLAPYISNRNKVLEGSGISGEEYELMKDILVPLGRFPQLATQSGA